MKPKFFQSVIILIFLVFLCSVPVRGSVPKHLKEPINFSKKNIVYLQIINHFEERGENAHIYSNPELAIGYDRKLFSLAKNHFFIGLKTGLYFETALTARDYDNTYHHPFIGLYPSYMFAPVKWFKIQVAGAWDVIFETHDDLDDFWWWYFGIEPSVQFYPMENIFVSVGAAIGKFPWFEPPVDMTKAFVKAGFCF